MDESLIRSVSLFFYLHLFDPRLAFLASQKTLARWRDVGSGVRSDLIPIAHKTLKSTKLPRIFNMNVEPGEFVVPGNVNLTAWREFKKRSDVSEFEAVLWSRVVRFSDEEVALGLGVTEGTVRHRVGRGLRELGACL